MFHIESLHMPIGDTYHIKGNNIASRIFQKLFGTPDLHTHLRLCPLIAFFGKSADDHKAGTIKVIEPGCGNGVNAFELVKAAGKRGKDMRYTGIDMNGQDIDKAKDLAAALDKEGLLDFRHGDAVEALRGMEEATADMILLIDIIEHVADAGELVVAAYDRLKVNGFLAVSVPTRLYPKVFGRKFHERIGHLKDGYSLEELDNLFKDLNCSRIESVYNTGLFASIGCWLYYSVLNSTNNFFTFLKAIILYPFIWLDIYNSPRVSCTLFAVYRKK